MQVLMPAWSFRTLVGVAFVGEALLPSFYLQAQMPSDAFRLAECILLGHELLSHVSRA